MDISITGPTGTHRGPRAETHFREREAKSGAENNGEEGQKTEAQFSAPWKAVKRSRDEGSPDCGHRFAHDGVRDEPESNDPVEISV